jgi:hypothetical protein
MQETPAGPAVKPAFEVIERQAFDLYPIYKVI